jgi:hypothetical protein
MTFTSPHDLDLALTAYADAVIARHAKWSHTAPAGQSTAAKISVTFERGSKFLRVVKTSYNSRHAYAFIAVVDTGKFKVGDILKPASWKAPAKNFARGNVFDPNTYQRHSPWGL